MCKRKLCLRMLKYLCLAIIIFCCWGLWDLAIYKTSGMYPLPFEIVKLPRYIAGDLFVTLIFISTIIILLCREVEDYGR